MRASYVNRLYLSLYFNIKIYYICFPTNVSYISKSRYLNSFSSLIKDRQFLDERIQDTR